MHLAYLFECRVVDKLIRNRTDHQLNALFKYKSISEVKSALR